MRTKTIYVLVVYAYGFVGMGAKQAAINFMVAIFFVFI